MWKKRPSSSQIHNKKELKSRRKTLRNDSTSAEATLWLLLKGKQLDGRKFRRQHSVGKYVLDFYCPSENLSIELDGAVHFTPEGMEYDEKRRQFLDNCGIRILRFENYAVFEHPQLVVIEIKKAFRQLDTDNRTEAQD
jgi:very-short-patch-repair endonuclease